MQEIPFPFTVTFADCEPSAAVRFLVEDQLLKISQIYNRITECKVTVRIPHRHSGQRFFHIHLQMDVPGRRLVVTRETEKRDAHTEIGAAIRDAFHKLTRQLEDFLRARAETA